MHTQLAKHQRLLRCRAQRLWSTTLALRGSVRSPHRNRHVPCVGATSQAAAVLWAQRHWRQGNIAKLPSSHPTRAGLETLPAVCRTFAQLHGPRRKAGVLVSTSQAH